MYTRYLACKGASFFPIYLNLIMGEGEVEKYLKISYGQSINECHVS
jgi:hypothetical protein